MTQINGVFVLCMLAVLLYVWFFSFHHRDAPSNWIDVVLFYPCNRLFFLRITFYNKFYASSENFMSDCVLYWCTSVSSKLSSCRRCQSRGRWLLTWGWAYSPLMITLDVWFLGAGKSLTARRKSILARITCGPMWVFSCGFFLKFCVSNDRFKWYRVLGLF